MIIDYSKTVIYKIFCKDSNITDTYIGHTTNFNKRKRGHKKDCYNENDRKYNHKCII
jgi:predicted GIY-YIG superfamily endonuclease